MERKKKPKGYWDNFENCKREIELYSSMKEFRETNSGARRSIKKNGWEFLYDYYEHRNLPNTWTKEKCADIAKDCNNIRDFRNISEVAYRKTINNDWFDDICSHFEPLGNSTLRMIYFVDFGNKVGYVGLTCDFNQRRRGHLSYGPVHNYMMSTGVIPTFNKITDYTDKKLAQKNEAHYEKHYKNLGYTLLNRAKTGALGGNGIIWTYDACKIEAKKYNTRTDYQNNSGSSYGRALKEGWLDDICKDMDYLCSPSNLYNEEDIFLIASKYTLLKDFREKEPTACHFAKKLKIYNKVKLMLKTLWDKKIVLNLNTGIFYETTLEASNTINISNRNLRNRLNGIVTNNTPFVLV